VVCKKISLQEKKRDNHVKFKNVTLDIIHESRPDRGDREIKRGGTEFGDDTSSNYSILGNSGECSKFGGNREAFSKLT